MTPNPPSLPPALAVLRSVTLSIFGLQPAPFAVPASLLSHAIALQPGGSGSVLALPVENAELQLFDTRHNRHVSIIQVSTVAGSFSTCSAGAG